MPVAVPRLLEVPGRPWTYVRLGELLRLRPDLFLAGKNTRLHELRAIRLAASEQSPVDWSNLPAALEGRLDGRVSHLEVERGYGVGDGGLGALARSRAAARSCAEPKATEGRNQARRKVCRYRNSRCMPQLCAISSAMRSKI